MKSSFAATVFNEERDIKSFIDSILNQTRIPDEIIIIDAGSTDRTYKILKSYGNKITPFIHKGNRSIGRNFGIEKANGEIILVSDAGCVLDKNWVRTITRPFVKKEVDVVSGYYTPVTNNDFEKALATYTCVMPDKLNPNTYLPSSRSIAIRKKAWKQVGGYPAFLETCEDLVFAKNLKDHNLTFTLAKGAIVHWRQQSNIIAAFKQFYYYAHGDGLAHYFRPQTPLLYFRYGLGLLLVIIGIGGYTLSYAILLLFSILYLLWAIKKNYRYVQTLNALIYLPVLQLLSDVAVLSGTTKGFIASIIKKV